MISSPGESSSSEVYQRLARVLTPGQAAMLESAIYDVRRSGGFGRVVLDLRGGVVKFVSVEIRKEAN